MLSRPRRRILVGGTDPYFSRRDRTGYPAVPGFSNNRMMAAASHRQLQPPQQKLPPVHLYYLSWCFEMHTVFHPLHPVPSDLGTKPVDHTPLFHREWHVIRRMRSQCVPGPRPD